MARITSVTDNPATGGGRRLTQTSQTCPSPQTAKRRGNVRRLIDHSDQIDLTYGLYAMNAGKSYPFFHRNTIPGKGTIKSPRRQIPTLDRNRGERSVKGNAFRSICGSLLPWFRFSTGCPDR